MKRRFGIMMGKRGQMATEYMILTGFILVSVAIIFVFSFLNYSQNIKVAQANEALSKMASAVDDVYTRGEGNTRFVYVSFPEGMADLGVIHKCREGEPPQGAVAECTGGTYDDVNFSAIYMDVGLIGGQSRVMKETRAKVWESPVDFLTAEQSAGSAYTVKVSWRDDETIQVERVH